MLVSFLSKASEVNIDMKLQLVESGDALVDLGSWEFSEPPGIISGGREERLNWLDALESLSENSILKSAISFLSSRESSPSKDNGFSQFGLNRSHLH